MVARFHLAEFYVQVENSHPRVHHSHARVETRALIDEHPAFVYDHRSAIDVEPVVGAAAVGLVVSHNTLAVATSPNPSFSPNVLELAAAASGRIYGNVITAKKTGLQGFPATALHVGAAFTGTIDHNTIRGGDIGVLTEAAPFQRQHVVGNTIGAAGSGTVGGISVVRPSAGTMIGGGDLTKLAGNVITCNTGDGIVATGGTATIAGNTVSGHKGANARCIAADGTVQVLSNVVYDNAQGIVGTGRSRPSPRTRSTTGRSPGRSTPSRSPPRPAMPFAFRRSRPRRFRACRLVPSRSFRWAR